MSKSGQSPGGDGPPGVAPSRLSNQTNSATPDRAAETPNPESRPAHLPTVEERVADFLQEYPDRAQQPVSEVDGRDLRREAVDVESTVREVDVLEEGGRTATVELEEDLERRARPWYEVVRAFLSWYEGYRGRRLRMAKGRPERGDYEVFEVELDNSWTPAYQNKQYAELSALERETCGGGRPNGETAGAFEEPVAVMITRTASGVCGGEVRPPVDHDREIVEAYSEGGVRRSLRYVLDSNGVPSEKWVRWSQSEPHPGGGHAKNACMGHPHDMLIIDEAAVDGEVTREMFRPVIEKHVEEAEHAGETAHTPTPCEEHASGEPWSDVVSGCEECKTPVEVRDAEEGVESPAEYMATYISVDEDVDLLERSTEYIAWAAVQWATNTQRKKASDTVGHAVDADACKQRAEEPECDQVRQHGEEVRRTEIRGRRKLVCSCCGSPWGIDQDRTLVETRLEEPDAEPSPSTAEVSGEVVADGGVSRDADAELAAKWPSASSGAAVDGGGVDAERTPGPVWRGFDRPAEWRADAVIESDGEEHGVSPGGVDMVSLKLPEERAVGDVDGARRDTTRTYEVVAAEEPVAEGRVEYVDGEEKLVSRETGDGTVWVCVECGRRAGSVYDFGCGHVDAERPEAEVPAEVQEEEPEEWVVPEHVVEWVRSHPGAGVSAVLGRFMLPPEHAGEVRDLLEEAGQDG